MKKYLKGFTITFFVSVCFVLGLSLFPMLENGYIIPRDDVSVFQPKEEKVFNEDELINYFSNCSLSIKIAHMRWESGMLFLKVYKSKSLTEESLYKDLFSILHESFVERQNVSKVRFHIQDSYHSFLLNANRKQIASDPKMRHVDNVSYKDYIIKKFEKIDVTSEVS